MLAPSVAELRQGSLVQYYPWDAAGEWGWFWQGASRRFVPLSSVERAPKGDSPDAGLWQGYARSGSAVARTAPTESAPAAHSFAQGDACSFYRWDAAGEWGWYWRGEARYYVRLSDFDLVAPGSASDKSLQWGWLPSDVRRYEAPSLLSAPGGTAPGGRISQFYLWDGSGEWGWCWVGSRREYFPLDGVELLPKNDAPDLSLQSGTALAALEGRAYPSASAPALASVASGTRMQFYLWDAARTWGWFWRGETKVYFPLADVKVDPKFYRQEGTAMYLDIEWAGQPNGYYCGPASGYMVLNHLGARTSKSGTSLTMDNLALYMGVDSSGTDSSGFRNALNNWLGWDAYQSIASPSYDQVHNAVMSAFSTGYPTVVHTYERRGGPHYNGHGNSSMGHFMVVDGYDTATDAVLHRGSVGGRLVGVFPEVLVSQPAGIHGDVHHALSFRVLALKT